MGLIDGVGGVEEAALMTGLGRGGMAPLDRAAAWSRSEVVKKRDGVESSDTANCRDCVKGRRWERNKPLCRLAMVT